MVRLLSAVALLAVVAAGCGAAQTRSSAHHGVPRALAQRWEARASAIAAAANAGDDCQALHLATSLRADVVATEQQVPRRLRAPLVTGVTALADRITCTPPPPATKPEKPPKHGHDEHGHHGHHGPGGGDGKDR